VRPAGRAGTLARVDERRLARACEAVVDTVSRDARYGHTSHLHLSVAGRVVFDQHLRGSAQADVFSVTKTVLALLCGAAVARGHRPDLDLRVADVRPDLADTVAAEHTVRHLLTRTRGARTDGPWDPDEWTLLPTGQVRHVASAPARTPAGRTFSYDNAGAHLLAALLHTLVPGGLSAFADDVLFAPLGVTDRSWATDDAGVPYGHAHLQLTAAGLAAVGRLLLEDGQRDGHQLVDRRFLAQMTTPSSSGGPPERLPYGWLCWLDGRDVLAAGWAGQAVLVRRRDAVVVVVTGDPRFRPGPPPSDDLPADWRAGLELVRREVLPLLV
jgi:CubicO group peptidase (beta-lactamase class C family)